MFCYIGSSVCDFFVPFMMERLKSCFKSSVIILGITSLSNIAGYIYVILSLKYDHLLVREKEENYDNDNSKKDELMFSDIKYLPMNYWILIGTAFSTGCAYWNFMGFITDFFLFRYNLSYNVAKNYATGVPF